ncbi:MAG: BMC domain-containing protein [Kiritimatiellae bacterium]|nr:BMC domain-containing protein [Kiritimatiellia bacterium]MDD4117041.1 BMC domain-containing protein [Kiritimatiellia bacterium]
MKPHPAFASIEFSSVPAGLFAADALLKKSPIGLIRTGTIGGGKFLILLAGSTASVAEAHEEALFHGGLQVADDAFLPDIHPALYDALLGNVRQMGDGPLLIFETPTVSCNIQAIERAMKGVPVTLIEFRTGGAQLGGRGLSILQGDLYDIEAAQEIALSSLETRGIPAQHRVLTSPHDALLAQISVSTRFDRAQALTLDGETHVS